MDEQKFDRASLAFAQASKLYTKLGDVNAAEVLLGESKRYVTEVKLFVEQPVDTAAAKSNFTGARFEPVSGCFTGVNIEREDMTSDPVKFDRIFGKHQAMFFMYRSYRMLFPIAFARKLRSIHAGLQLAYEPRAHCCGPR